VIKLPSFPEGMNGIRGACWSFARPLHGA